jgi:AraC family transcriptional regulator of adaptative response/methylated-DNA-[protein]-cysteine methyltransferase
MKTMKTQLHLGKNVTTAMYESGYGSSSRLYERAQSNMGMTPGTYGKGGKGMRIAYATASCPLGRLLVASTTCGLCAVTLGDSDQLLETALQSEYPKADIFQDHQSLKHTVEAVLKYLAGKEPRLDFPVDVRATAFQIRVWEELRRIPYGTTRSYSDVAKLLKPERRTGSCARMCDESGCLRYCHRVVGRTGELTGYRWSKERKAALLEAEQKRKSQ